jgi:glycosyltransferase involved in cell wall biosynthesis
LMSLVHQTSQDFEIILVVHSQGVEVAAGVWEAVEEIRRILGNRIKLVTCNRIGRAAPLNDGVAQARGQYVTLLDDDDIALAHWVETFQKLAFQAPSGSLLRAACVRQDFAAADNLSAAPQALSEFKSDYPLSFNMLSHLSENSTPAMCVAYPVGVFQQDGLRFDEGLSTVEDWDFLMRAVMLRGIVSTPEVTSIYRWGAAADTSSTMHEPSEWVANLAAVHKKLDLAPVLLPAGFASELRSLRETYFKAAIQLMMIGGTIPSISDDLELTKIVDRMLIGHLGSLSWRLTRPLRQILRWSMRQPSSEWTIEHIPLSLHERLLILQQIQHSWSWKITHPLRILARVAPRLRSLMSR